MKITNAFDGTKAKKGDRVWSLRYGWGTVSREFSNSPYPIIGVVFDEYARGVTSFTNEGRLRANDKAIDLYYGPPEIIGPPKPKRMVKKDVRGWANVYSWGFGGICKTKERADYYAEPARIACVELTGTYEVEED